MKKNYNLGARVNNLRHLHDDIRIAATVTLVRIYGAIMKSA